MKVLGGVSTSGLYMYRVNTRVTNAQPAVRTGDHSRFVREHTPRSHRGMGESLHRVKRNDWSTHVTAGVSHTILDPGSETSSSCFGKLIVNSSSWLLCCSTCLFKSSGFYKIYILAIYA